MAGGGVVLEQRKHFCSWEQRVGTGSWPNAEVLVEGGEDHQAPCKDREVIELYKTVI